jgi:hypothetical protein
VRQTNDPRPNTARLPDGSPDVELETRLRVLFTQTGPLDCPKPTDLASALVMLQELWERSRA